MKEEESVTGRGSGQARADFIIWRTIQGQGGPKAPPDHCRVQVRQCDYQTRGLSPGRPLCEDGRSALLVTHNTRETRFWRVRQDRMPGYLEEIENIPHADARTARFRSSFPS